MDLHIKKQAEIFSKMADDVGRKFPNDIMKQAKTLGKAFDKITKGTFKKKKYRVYGDYGTFMDFTSKRKAKRYMKGMPERYMLRIK